MDSDNEKYSAELKAILKTAERTAEEFGVSYIASEHLLLAILTSSDCMPMQIFIAMGVNIRRLANALEQTLELK